jgi:hypothetical protein
VRKRCRRGCREWEHLDLKSERCGGRVSSFRSWSLGVCNSHHSPALRNPHPRLDYPGEGRWFTRKAGT